MSASGRHSCSELETFEFEQTSLSTQPCYKIWGTCGELGSKVDNDKFTDSFDAKYPEVSDGL